MVAQWTTLHVNDRMMPIFPRRRGGESKNIFCLHLLHDLFETESGYVVALIHDHLAILGHEVLYLILSI